MKSILFVNFAKWRIAIEYVARAERFLAGARPAARSRPMSESVCPVSLCARAPRPRVHNSRRLAPPADYGACESIRSGQGLLAVADASATRQRRHHTPTNLVFHSARRIGIDHKCRALVCVRGWGEDAARTKEKG
ncbi:unnamed protein product [Parnassius apollo]|uniref:(apollo) hypothetical protein n=1 Tax=Parnassius apollo TaxID=110799 RepID=A0A8S3X3Q0_PARAO|nr:unnamed protein product [Parnassius apollo]